MTTILYHPLSRLHNPTYSHPDNPARIDAILEVIKPYRTQRPQRQATFDELTRVHTPEYIRSVLKQQCQKGSAGPGAPLTEHSADAALWSAGAAIEAADIAMRGETSFAFCRPAGHHARPSTGMGFCVFNNVAIAAAHCLAKGLERVFILDWDVHHGNGTQEIFYDNGRVFFCSIHQKTAYPHSGTSEEKGSGAGLGFNRNINLEEDSDDSDYLFCIKEIVVPVIRDFDPQVILVSAGFDAHRNDPLSNMAMTNVGYGEMTQQIWKVAQELEIGLALVLEGGYSIHSLGDCVASCLDVLPEAVMFGEETPEPDPALLESMAMRYRHDFGLLDSKHQAAILVTMRQLWEEVAGLGFYRPLTTKQQWTTK